MRSTLENNIYGGFLSLALVYIHASAFFYNQEERYYHQNCPCENNCADVLPPAIENGDPEMNMRTPDFIRRNGYPVETHNITTYDEYILTYYRIPYGVKSPPAPNKVAVYVMHGQFFSSVSWMYQPPNRALVFMLADAGYDVWIGNARGTSYSLGHKTLSYKGLDYWNFSVDEMGKYDVPRVMQYILKRNGQKNLYYIGHSLGTAQFFIAMSYYPSLNRYVRTMFAMAPEIYEGNSTTPPYSVATTAYYNWPTINSIGQGKFNTQAVANQYPQAGLGCAETAQKCNVCDNVLFALFGSDPCQLNTTVLASITYHLPDFASAKTSVHSLQLQASATFRRFDYGSELNFKFYGRSTPPDYNVNNIRVPVVLFGGLADRVVPADFARTSNVIPNLHGNFTVPFPLWNHADYALGIDADRYIYRRIITMMTENDSFENSSK